MATTISNTSDADIVARVAKARAAFTSGRTRPLSFRRAQLQRLLAMITERADTIREALKKDLGSNEFFTDCIELEIVRQETVHLIRHLEEYSASETVSTPLLQKPGKSVLGPEPYGLVLSITPWNYPVSLTLVPLATALAAGNAVVLKMSEVSVHTSLALAALIQEYLDPEAVQIVQGDKDPTTTVLAQRFDLIFYTGNGAVARIVYAAAAKHLTPVILELGGKSPAIVTNSADIKKCAPRICWGKWSMNVGQTCISPDYILCTEEKFDELREALLTTLNSFFTDSPKTCKDYSRIISPRHTQRLQKLLQDDTISILTGGDVDVEERYISPTVLRATLTSKCMQEEIFGPILPILVLKSVEEMVQYVNEHEKPLAMYIFSESKSEQEKIIEQTSAGGVCVNDCIMHAANPNLPFGGVGESGMGSYHGKFGFDNFSHKKPIFYKYSTDPSLRFPPYTQKKLNLVKRINKVIEILPSLNTVLLSLSVALLAVVVYATLA
eukprot:m.187124 g.187124  ORF g.187124 m.187124 type:complete len:497 (-) comp21616_c1_seq3:68-1558(-)